MFGRTVLSSSFLFPTRVSADGSPKYKYGGITIDWANTVVASGSVVNLADGSQIGSGRKYLRYGQVMTKITKTATETVTVGGGASGGNLVINVTTPSGTVTTAQTATIAYTTGLTAATVQAALVALSNVGAGNVTVTGSNGGTSSAEVDTITWTSPTAGDVVTIQAGSLPPLQFTVNATATATSTTTQAKEAWNGNAAYAALGTATGTTTFIVTGAVAGQALNISVSQQGTGTAANVVTAAGLPYTFTFANSLGPVTVTASAASLTGGSPTAVVATAGPGGNYGWFGPYDPAATDGRAVLTRGECFILDQTLLQYSADSSQLSVSNDQVGGVIEGGSVFLARILQSGTAGASLSAGPTLANLQNAFPLLSYVGSTGGVANEP